MKKHTLLTAMLVCMLMSIPWLKSNAQVTVDYSQNFYTIKANSDAYFDNLRQQLLTQGITSMAGTGYTPYLRWLREWEPLVYPSGSFQAPIEAKVDLARAKKNQTLPFAKINGNWEELGPFITPVTTLNRYQGVGRLEYITVNPNDDLELYVTSKQGGLYFSLDGGESWENGGTDQLSFPGLSSVAVDPNNNQHWVVSSWETGGAMYETTNGGANWNDISNGLPTQWLFWETIQLNEVKADPLNFNILYLATTHGLYVRNAADATPQWQKIYPASGMVRMADIEFDPNNSQHIYASGEMIIESTDGGQTFNQMPNTDVFTSVPASLGYTANINLELSTVDEFKIYAVITGQDLSVANGSTIPSVLYRFNATTSLWDLRGNIDMLFGRFRALAVDPQNPEVLYAGNIHSVKRSANAGQNWTSLPTMMHDDKQDFIFTQGGNQLWSVNDGGVFRGDRQSTSPYHNFVDKTVNIGVARCHAISINKYNSETILMGNYDKGSDVYYRSSGIWLHCTGGDGYSNAIDYDDPNYMYTTAVGGRINRANNGFQTEVYSQIFGLPSSNWQTWITMHPQESQTIYRNGVDLYKSTDRGITWNSILNVPTLDPNYNEVLRMWKAPNHGDVTYARLLAGSADPTKIVRTFDENNPTPQSTWQDLPVALPFDYWIRDIAIDEENPEKFWIAYLSIKPGFVQKVWYFDGTTFIALPDMPDFVEINSIEHEHGTNNRVYIGTTAGVFYYQDGDGVNDWTELEGLPRNRVDQMEIDYCSRKLIVGIFGRGVWQGDLLPENNSPRIISGTEVISERQDIYSDIIIPSGATLEITDEVHMAASKKIVVEIGGRLIVNGGTLTKQCDQQWAGIVVQGDVNQHQFTLQNGLLGQGYVEVKNGGTIEHARVAVNLWQPGDWNSTGGILIADHSAFRNNWRSIVAMPYTNFYPTGGKAPNKTRISYCDFDVNDNQLGNGFDAHVVLYKVLGINISASNFADSRTTLNSSAELGNGIISLDAKYTVRGQCDQGLCTTITPSTFTGLRKGIWAMRIGTPYTFVVDRCEFYDNIEGVFNSGVNDATVTRSTFSVGSNAYTNNGAIIQLGVKFEGATRFTIEENTLNATAPPAWLTVGILVASAGEDDNMVYKNSVTNFYVGNLSNHYNRDPNDVTQGLEYTCNDHLNSIFDIGVVGADVVNDGIGSAQGSIDIASGNTFSLNANNPTSDFSNQVSPSINYYFLQGGTSEEPLSFTNIFLFNSDDPNTCESNFSNEQHEHLYPLKSAQKTTLLNTFTTSQTNYNSFKLIYDVLLDGGNTAEIEVEIDNAWPSETWELRAELLGATPLSVGVLKRAANRTTVLPNAVMFEILQANPDAMRGNAMANYLRTKADPMPEYMIDLLEAGAGVETYQTILESTLNYHAGNMFRAADFLIADALNDTIEPDSIVFDLAMNRRAGYNAQISKFENRLSEGQLTEATAILANLPNHVPFGDQAAIELGHYTALAQILIDLETGSRQLSDLTATEIEQITIVANTSERMPAAIANNILNFTQAADRFSTPLLPDLKATGKRAGTSGTQNDVSLGKNTILAHPNPANEWVAFDYQLANPEAKTMLVVRNAKGDVIWKESLTQPEGQVVWNTTEIAAGNYVYALQIGGKTSESGLIVVVH